MVAMKKERESLETMIEMRLTVELIVAIKESSQTVAKEQRVRDMAAVDFRQADLSDLPHIRLLVFDSLSDLLDGVQLQVGRVFRKDLEQSREGSIADLHLHIPQALTQMLCTQKRKRIAEVDERSVMEEERRDLPEAP
jgi:hypothetical protein